MKLIHPVDGRISQLFGENPQVYTPLGVPGHDGLDYAVDRATVHVAADGLLCGGMLHPAYGQTLVAYHPDLNGWTIYAHLFTPAQTRRESSLRPLFLRTGVSVRAGAPLGISGGRLTDPQPARGYSTGAHLHFGLYLTDGLDSVFGGAVDPMLFMEHVQRGKVVILDGLNVRAGPGKEHKILNQIAYNSSVTILEERGAWWRIGLNEWICATRGEDVYAVKIEPGEPLPQGRRMIDVAHWERVSWGMLDDHIAVGIRAINFERGKSGIVGEDEQFDYNFRRSAGHPRFFYMFYTPSPELTGAQQARMLCRTVGRGERLAFDFEPGRVANVSHVAEDVRQAVELLEEFGGQPPIFYSRPDLLRGYFPDNPDWLTRCPLWLAYYPKFYGGDRWDMSRYDAQYPAAPAGFNLWAWQFSEKGNLLAVRGQVDLNWLYGEL